MPRLLENIRVVECSMLLNGAATSMMLADLGADVIKVESPFLGDYIRAPDTAHMHRQVNRAKRSLALDLRKPAGQEVFARLIARADVFVTNATPRRATKLGYDLPAIRAIRPDIIYCQNTGFGASGPWAEIPTHGQMMDAMAGGTPVAMTADGLVEADPRFARRTASLASGGEGTAAGAIYSAFHIAAALVRRAQTGEGAYLDTSSAAAVLASAWTGAVALLNRPERDAWWQTPANTLPIARYQAYRTADDRFVLFCPEERRFWQSFCKVVDRPDLLDRERGLDLRHEVQRIIAGRTQAAWIEIARLNDIPIGPINNTIGEVRDDPQLRARRIVADEGEGEQLRQPVFVDGEPSVIGAAAPGLGEHNDDVLAALGYGPDEIAALAAAEVTAAPPRDDAYSSGAIFGTAKD